MTDIIERLAACMAGTVTPEERDAITLEACAEITRLRLTDAEREAISRAVDIYEFHWRLADEAHAATLRRLLERAK